jgi:hypothetical protein
MFGRPELVQAGFDDVDREVVRLAERPGELGREVVPSPARLFLSQAYGAPKA